MGMTEEQLAVVELGGWRRAAADGRVGRTLGGLAAAGTWRTGHGIRARLRKVTVSASSPDARRPWKC